MHGPLNLKFERMVIRTIYVYLVWILWCFLWHINWISYSVAEFRGWNNQTENVIIPYDYNAVLVREISGLDNLASWDCKQAFRSLWN